MKKILKNNAKTRAYLSSCPNIYITACWARWGVRAYSFSGKWNTDENGVCYPLVWFYNDYNGAADRYELRDIRSVTSGTIANWSFYQVAAEKLAEKLNEDAN